MCERKTEERIEGLDRADLKFILMVASLHITASIKDYRR